MGLYASDGRLLISFRDTAHDSPTKGDWVAWVGTYDDIVQGREGQYRVRLMDNHKGGDCAYPAVERLPDGAFVVTAYGHWTPGEAPWIASVRLLQRASPSTCRHRTGSTANTRLSQALVSNTCPPRSTTVQRPATLDACTGLPGGFLGKSQTNVFLGLTGP